MFMCLDLHVGCYAMCIYSLFVSWYIFFLRFGPLGRVWIKIWCSRPTSTHLGLHQRVWISSFMHVYACFLLCFISMFACLDLGFAMLFAWHGLMLISLWGHLLVWLHKSLLWLVWMWRLVRHISMMLVCLIHTFLRLVRWCYACLACFVPPIWLSLLLYIFARLPTYSCMGPCLLVSSSLIPTISCGFTPVFDTEVLESFIGILFDDTCVIHTLNQWNYGHPI